MLYGECKQYLIDKLKAAGVKTKPFTTRKSLERSQESHVSAVLFQNEAFARNGSKKLFKDQEGAQHKRKKVFDRTVTFSVVIGGYTDDEVEGIFEAFVLCLDQGIYVDGNYVPIAVSEADWVDRDDSILKAQVAVEVQITFEGGIYKDTDFAPLSEVRITSTEKDRRKESTDVD